MRDIICNACSKEFKPRIKTTRYCSNKCARQGQRFWQRATNEEKLERNKTNFFRYVNKGYKNECWNWTGRLIGGYGGTRYNNKRTTSHRVSWRLFNGEIPNELCVLHKCDNPKCVNPEHLFLGTREDNNHDRANKGRSTTKSNFGNAIPWTSEDINQILKYYEDGMSLRKISAKFEVDKATIKLVLKKENKFKPGRNPCRPVLMK